MLPMFPSSPVYIDPHRCHTGHIEFSDVARCDRCTSAHTGLLPSRRSSPVYIDPHRCHTGHIEFSDVARCDRCTSAHTGLLPSRLSSPVTITPHRCPHPLDRDHIVGSPHCYSAGVGQQCAEIELDSLLCILYIYIYIGPHRDRTPAYFVAFLAGASSSAAGCTLRLFFPAGSGVLPVVCNFFKK